MNKCKDIISVLNKIHNILLLQGGFFNRNICYIKNIGFNSNIIDFNIDITNILSKIKRPIELLNLSSIEFDSLLNIITDNVVKSEINQLWKKVYPAINCGETVIFFADGYYGVVSNSDANLISLKLNNYELKYLQNIVNRFNNIFNEDYTGIISSNDPNELYQLYFDYISFMETFANLNNLSNDEASSYLLTWGNPKSEIYFQFIIDSEIINSGIKEFYGILLSDNFILHKVSDIKKINFLKKLGVVYIVGYNIADFDLPLILDITGIDMGAGNVIIDLMWIYNFLFPVNTGCALDDACSLFNINISNRHTASGDTEATRLLWNSIKILTDYSYNQNNNFISHLANLVKKSFYTLDIINKFVPDYILDKISYVEKIDKSAIVCTGGVCDFRTVVIAGKFHAKNKFTIVSGNNGITFKNKTNAPMMIQLLAERFSIFKVSDKLLLTLPVFVEAVTTGSYLHYFIQTIQANTPMYHKNNHIIINFYNDHHIQMPDNYFKNLSVFFITPTNLEQSIISSFSLTFPILISLVDNEINIAKYSVDPNNNISIDNSATSEIITKSDYYQTPYIYNYNIEKKELKCIPVFWNNIFRKIFSKSKAVKIDTLVNNKNKTILDDYIRLISNNNVEINCIPVSKNNKNTINEKVGFIKVNNIYNKLNNNIFVKQYALLLINAVKTYNKILFIITDPEAKEKLKYFLIENKDIFGDYKIDTDISYNQYNKKHQYYKKFIILINLREASKFVNTKIDYLIFGYIPVFAETSDIFFFRKNYLNEKYYEHIVANGYFQFTEANPISTFETIINGYYKSFPLVEHSERLLKLFNRNNLKQIHIFTDSKNHNKNTNSFYSLFLQMLNIEQSENNNYKNFLAEIEHEYSSVIDKIKKDISINFKDYEKVLKEYWGKDHVFRDFTEDEENPSDFPDNNYKISGKKNSYTQADIIHYALRAFHSPYAYEKKDIDTFVVAATGKGKSMLYQIPAIMLSSEENPSLVIIISPLLALMNDQINSLNKNGVTTATTLNSQIDIGRYNLITCLIKEQLYNIIFVAPETFSSKRFQEILKFRDPSLMIIDEAHCISQWGHDFRIEYKKLSPVINNLYGNRSFPLFALTATAKNSQKKEKSVVEDIIRCLKLNIDSNKVIRSSTIRKNLFYGTIFLESGKYDKIKKIIYEKADEICNIIKNPNKYIDNLQIQNENIDDIKSQFKHPKTLVYCRTRKETESLAEYLTNNNNITADYYHAGLNKNDKKGIENKFKEGKIKVICSTIAFGMGVDIPDIRLVIHYTMSSSIENYYQEAGRAGRDGNPSLCLLLYCDSFSKGFQTINDFGEILSLNNKNRIEFTDLGSVFYKIKAFSQNNPPLISEDKEIYQIPAESLLFSIENKLSDSDTRIKTILYYLSKDFNTDNPIEYEFTNGKYKLSLKENANLENLDNNEKYFFDRLSKVISCDRISEIDRSLLSSCKHPDSNLSELEFLYTLKMKGLIKIYNEPQIEYNFSKDVNVLINAVSQDIEKDNNDSYKKISFKKVLSTFFNDSGPESICYDIQLKKELILSLWINILFFSNNEIPKANKYAKDYIILSGLPAKDIDNSIIKAKEKLLSFIKVICAVLRKYNSKQLLYDIYFEIKNMNEETAETLGLNQEFSIIKNYTSHLYYTNFIQTITLFEIIGLISIIENQSEQIFNITIDKDYFFCYEKNKIIYNDLADSYQVRDHSMKLLYKNYIYENLNYIDRAYFFEDYFNGKFDETVSFSERLNNFNSIFLNLYNNSIFNKYVIFLKKQHEYLKDPDKTYTYQESFHSDELEIFLKSLKNYLPGANLLLKNNNYEVHILVNTNKKKLEYIKFTRDNIYQNDGFFNINYKFRYHILTAAGFYKKIICELFNTAIIDLENYNAIEEVSDLSNKTINDMKIFFKNISENFSIKLSTKSNGKNEINLEQITHNLKIDDQLNYNGNILFELIRIYSNFIDSFKLISFSFNKELAEIITDIYHINNDDIYPDNKYYKFYKYLTDIIKGYQITFIDKNNFEGNYGLFDDYDLINRIICKANAINILDEGKSQSNSGDALLFKNLVSNIIAKHSTFNEVFIEEMENANRIYKEHQHSEFLKTILN